ncbi:hypothetical protein PLICRDRAFT_496526 [Plicaturopsis crispa FD-325 SS-3]|nr:hypothetical protein PLICRDRAFT_496526 [Plicaturopsis crispa FD-325 SS-3]
MASPTINRARFSPARYDKATSPCPPLQSEQVWQPILSCPADFPPELFEIAVSQLIHHPEYNSTLILRSETIAEITPPAAFPPSIPNFTDDLHALRCIHRKLLPRRPGRDSSLEQFCTLYEPRASAPEGVSASAPKPTTLILSPIVTPESPLPYYHPAVSHLAFRYMASPPHSASGPQNPGTLRIEAILLPEVDSDAATDPNSRLYRTCLALLETLHRYGWGALTHYKKRVQHDCIVPRETYQDMYLLMRARHRHLVDTWQEATDPLKHVFEDIGIATFLMLLWKDIYDPVASSPAGVDEERPWAAWPRPPGGFLDLGCGNGLLTHILTSEGYEGCGIDLRARTSWSHYPSATQSCLHVHALDPTHPPGAPDAYLKPGAFIIGNHADELTPWVPVLATRHAASGYLSIPCCAWTFDARFERSSTQPLPVPGGVDVEALNLGGDGSGASAYSMYRVWLAGLSKWCGWEIECETLRIPSTRNWALVGRRRTGDMEEARGRVEDIVTGVRDRGIFKTRKPEGKAGDH